MSMCVTTYRYVMSLPRICAGIFVAAAWLTTLHSHAPGQTHWQAEWDKTVRAAEFEGQVTLYGCCYDFDRVIEGFKNKYPKIKVATVLGFGNQLATRILAERRGDRNWFLSREEQIARQKFGRPDAHNSRRIDIGKNDVDEFNRLEDGKKYFDLAKPEYQDLSPIFKLVKEVLPQK